MAERDRRYSEVAAAQSSALKIAETAAREALVLARDIQTYKDQVHNGLLMQLKDERQTYASKAELRPIESYVASLQGRSGGLEKWVGWLFAAAMAAIAFFKT
jgi:hypothetical protein